MAVAPRLSPPRYDPAPAAESAYEYLETLLAEAFPDAREDDAATEAEDEVEEPAVAE